MHHTIEVPAKYKVLSFSLSTRPFNPAHFLEKEIHLKITAFQQRVQNIFSTVISALSDPELSCPCSYGPVKSNIFCFQQITHICTLNKQPRIEQGLQKRKNKAYYSVMMIAKTGITMNAIPAAGNLHWRSKVVFIPRKLIHFGEPLYL